MAKDKILQLENFVLGMRRDGSLTQEAERDENVGANPYILHSLKTLENYDIQYEDGGLATRAGYERYNSIVLSDTPKQIYYHTNLPRTSAFLIGIVGARWYKIQESIDHEMVIDEATTVTDGFKKPILSWNNRIFFATDSGWYWTDSDRLYDAVKYYQTGISKPSSIPILNQVGAYGNYTSWTEPNNIAGVGIFDLTDVTMQEIGSKYTPTADFVASALDIRMSFFYNLEKKGNMRLRIETIGLDGLPTGTLADTNSVSAWIDVRTIYDGFPDDRFGDYIWYRFHFNDTFTLEKDTDYGIIIETDDDYKANYSANATQFFVAFAYNAVAGGLYYTPSAWQTYANNIIYAFASFDEKRYYEYCYTYVNSTYQVESRPSPSKRVQLLQEQRVEIDVPQPVDPQIDKVRIYRRELATDQDVETLDSEIVDTYKYVTEISGSATVIPATYSDSLSTASLGAELQTSDHYRIGEADDTDQGLRGAIIPAGACVWKGRVWLFPSNSNQLYFSKKLEEDGATGLTGDSIPDYFPLENVMDLQEESAILVVKPLANDQLAIYFRNGTVYVLWGCDEITNPPTDYSLRPQVYGLGLISSWGLVDYKSSHIYVSRHGLYCFTGAPNPEYLSESIQSILDGISDTNLAKAVVIARGEEVWLLVDENDDGYNDTIYILNLQKTVKPWRRYTYGTNINDLLVKTLSSSSKDIIAADNTNKYLLELNTGTTDGGKPIESMLEFHKQKVSEAYGFKIEVKDSYDSNDMPASYEFIITDQTGHGAPYGINPGGSGDVRGHKIGARIHTYGFFNVQMKQLTVQQTELSGIYIRYIKR
jgi:hypothetical protein